MLNMVECMHIMAVSNVCVQVSVYTRKCMRQYVKMAENGGRKESSESRCGGGGAEGPRSQSERKLTRGLINK